MNIDDDSTHGHARHPTPLRVPTYFLSNVRRRTSRRNFATLLRFLLVLVVLVLAFATIFHLLMQREGQEHTFITGIYWALTVMSTLGFGDITFSTDIGRLFSLVVLLSGMVFLLVLLPFTFIEFFYEPWIEARAAARVPRALPADVSGHVVLTFYGPIASALTQKLSQYDYPYVVVLPELDDVLRLNDAGVRAVHGALDDPDTYVRVRVGEAALVATTRSDVVNTSVVFTVRGISDTVPIVATARDESAVEVLRLAGCTRILRLGELTGQALARRTRGGDRVAHVVGSVGDLLLAEVNAAETPLIGKTLAEARFGEIGIVGLWERGNFEIPRGDRVIEATTVLIVAGSRNQFAALEQLLHVPQGAAAPVIIVGGGRVGRAAARALALRGVDYRIVEMLPERIREADKYVLGSAASHDTLTRAGIEAAPTVILTTHDDETNIYLAIYCRLLRPDVQIISRASLERNVAPLQRAGSDFVLSSASMGANALFNLLRRGNLLTVAEGLDVFRVPVPKDLTGIRLEAADIFGRTGCTVIGIEKDGTTRVNPAAGHCFDESEEIVLIGTADGRSQFLKTFAARR